jgi:16S rRNA (guanine527-N7)-methyltransferase
MTAANVFRRQMVDWGIELGSGVEGRLHELARLLSTYDRANVIGTRDFDQVLVEHVGDSMSCLLVPELARAGAVADVGSGGGLPGIPLAIALPGTSFKLIESTGKKAAFLDHVVERLGLPNVEVINARVEDEAQDPTRRATHDISTVRAVARLPVIAEYCLPLLRVGGLVVAMKGRVSKEEREEGDRAVRLLGGSVLRTVEVPALREREQKARTLVVLEKVGETPGAYPRRVGIPAKKPLGRA